MPNDSASRYGPVDDSYEGFHTYATSDLYDTNDGSERWPDNWVSSHPVDPPADDGDPDGDEPPARRDYWSPLLWTIIWYGIPAVVIILRTVLAKPPAEQTRAEAMAAVVSNSPLWLMAMLSGLVLALVLRWASDTWHAATIGFCAAVVSGGAVTVLYRIW